MRLRNPNICSHAHYIEFVTAYIPVPNVPAWVCPEDGEVSFTPETVDELIPTVRELVEIARKAR